MGCCKDQCENENCMCPNEQVIQGLKAKLLYQGCDLMCSPISKCACDKVLEDIEAANGWISNLPGNVEDCVNE